MKIIDDILSLVKRQAEDNGLWFVAHNASEAYLQSELKRLHSAIEEEMPKLKGEIESLKCCGNCRNYRYGNLCDGQMISHDSYCDSWHSDGLTRKEREK